MEKRSYLKGQSFRVILKGGGGDVGNKYSGCSLLTSQDLLFTLVTPFCAPVAPLDAWHRPSAVVAASCCVQAMKALSGAREAWWAAESEVGTPISFPTRMQVGCVLLKRMPTPIRQDSHSIYDFSNLFRASEIALFPYPFRARRGVTLCYCSPRVMVNLP